MHSLKNTVVAILLLGVSYGVYQVITAPEPLSTADQNLIEPLDIDDGLSATSSTDEADVQLPSAVPAPVNASNAMTSPRTNPANLALPKLNQRASSQAKDNSSVELSTESLANRQAKLDFTGRTGLNEKLASAEVDDGDNNFARDQELIDALKKQLEADDNANSSNPGFDGAPRGELVSVRPSPEAESLTRSGNHPDENQFARVASAAEAAPPLNVAAPNAATATDPLKAVWSNVEAMSSAGQFRKALETLTPYFGDPDLSDIQRQRLMGWLDALAGKVIYSAEHNLNKPYLVQANESLDDIASRWNVTSQLVYNINMSNIANPAELMPGNELKMVQGPFHAEIDLTNNVMTLFVEDLYAGRFDVQVDDHSAIDEGQYGVKQKSVKGTTADGQPAAHMIALDNGVCIQASSDTNSNPLCIGLTPKDAADLFIIFTEQSQFFIKR